jgi:hypothetical protein
MENSQVPKFKHSVKEKNRQPYEYFLTEAEPRQNPNFDDYVLLRRLVQSNPILAYLIKLMGAKWIKNTEKD